MASESALKKIEEQSKADRAYALEASPQQPVERKLVAASDARVKLARALDKLPALLHLAVLGEATDAMLELAHAEVVTTLREVANG